MRKKNFDQLLKDVQQTSNSSSKEGMDFGIALTPKQIRRIRISLLFLCVCFFFVIYIFLTSADEFYSFFIRHKIVRTLKSDGYYYSGLFIWDVALSDLSQKDRKLIVEELLKSLEDPNATIRMNVVSGLGMYFQDCSDQLLHPLIRCYKTEKDPFVKEKIAKVLFDLNLQKSGIYWEGDLQVLFNKLTSEIGEQFMQWQEKLFQSILIPQNNSEKSE